MGGAVSTGVDNDDLIDNLLGGEYIKSPTVERVFRAVDRAEYFPAEARSSAYKDLAWKHGNLHLSAPCIYSEVMEGLCLEPGLSFLNLGSGTGYLSTMVGLILGSKGVNHGIEVHRDVVEYAEKKLRDFVLHSGAIDEFDFCEPRFEVGNCLCLSSENRRYDRVYCGAACPEAHEMDVKSLLNIGGILVMPMNDQLLKVTRKSEVEWDTTSLLPVSFATLITPDPHKREDIKLVETTKSLQALCRTIIRNMIRKNIESEYPNVMLRPQRPKTTKRKTRALRRLVVPLFDEYSDDSTSEDDMRMGIESWVQNLDRVSHANRQRRDLGRFALDNSVARNNATDGSNDDDEETGENGSQNQQEQPPQQQQQQQQPQPHRRNRELNTLIDIMLGMQDRLDNNGRNRSLHDDDGGGSGDSNNEEAAGPALNGEDGSEDESENEAEHDKIECDDCPNEENVNRIDEPNSTEEAAPLAPAPPALAAGRYKFTIEPQQKRVVDFTAKSSSSKNEDIEDDDDDEPVEMDAPAQNNEEESSSSSSKCERKREKFDSGLGDEVESDESNSSVPTCSTKATAGSGSVGEDERRHKRCFQPGTEIRIGKKWCRVFPNSSENSCSSDMENMEEKAPTEEDVAPSVGSQGVRMVGSQYTPHMRTKIQQLPIPIVLKNYLNFFREN